MHHLVVHPAKVFRLIHDYLRNEQFNLSPVAQFPEHSDLLPAIGLLCKVKPDACIYEHVYSKNHLNDCFPPCVY